MSRFSRINPDDESGVTLVIVAILIVALFGMLTLVVDVGGLLVKKRSMVAAADAASLAAAESCAVGHLSPLHPGGPNAGLPEDVADQYALKNATGLNSSIANIVPGETVGCETATAGRVTVSYTAPQTIYFGQVVGTGSSTNVTAKATAEWVPGGASNPVPFVIQAGSFQSGNCDIPNVPIGTTCHFWEDNGGGGAGGFGGSTFGYVDTNPNAWNVDPNGCPINPDKGSLQDYAGLGGYDGRNGPLSSLNYPDPTWVCGMDGLTTPTFDELWKNRDKILAFPVVDGPPNMVTQGSFVSAWDVIGFVKMKLVDICPAKKPCFSGDSSGGSSGSCQYSVAPSFSGPLDLDSGGGVGQTGTCPNTTANVDSLTPNPPTMVGCGATVKSPCVLGTNYTYDSTNHIVQFIGAARTVNVTISFDWEIYGKCGQPASNASGYCFVLEWEGIQLGNAPGGANFGVVNTRLCDATISKSCKSIP